MDDICFCGKANQIPISPDVTQKGVILIEKAGINIVDTSDADNFRFEIAAEDVDALIATLIIVAKTAGVTKTQPVLKGTTIDEVNLSWTYNKPSIASQTLENNGALGEPTLVAADRSYDYESQTITGDIAFTLSGDDGLSLAGSIDDDTKSIAFGNTFYLGHGTSKILTATAGLAAFITGLPTKITKTSRIHTYFATGGENQKHFVAYPAAYGLGTFTKGVLPGGYVRLKNVAGTLKSVLDPGDVETAISITNTAGFSESYYVYESLFDDQADPINPFVIS